jgi:hypothetical protein
VSLQAEGRGKKNGVIGISTGGGFGVASVSENLNIDPGIQPFGVYGRVGGYSGIEGGHGLAGKFEGNVQITGWINPANPQTGVAPDLQIGVTVKYFDAVLRGQDWYNSLTMMMVLSSPPFLVGVYYKSITSDTKNQPTISYLVVR